MHLICQTHKYQLIHRVYLTIPVDVNKGVWELFQLMLIRECGNYSSASLYSDSWVFSTCLDKYIKQQKRCFVFCCLLYFIHQNKQENAMLFVIYRYSQGFISKLEANSTELEQHRTRTSPFSKSKAHHEAAALQLKSGALKPAATVECSKEDLFRVTNSINRSWIDNKEVIMFDKDAFLSSTSVGDVFKAGDGNFYIVEDAGFALLEIDDMNGKSYPLPNTHSIY
jgi:hypothetical protein